MLKSAALPPAPATRALLVPLAAVAALRRACLARFGAMLARRGADFLSHMAKEFSHFNFYVMLFRGQFSFPEDVKCL